LERVAHAMESELKRSPGTREITTVGGPHRVINIVLNPQALRAVGLTVSDLSRVLQSAEAV
jgi:multidrug efflux pump subunit AcrB